MLTPISHLLAGSLVALGCVCCCACPSDCCAASNGGACGCPGCPACANQASFSKVTVTKLIPEVQPTAVQPTVVSPRQIPTARSYNLDATRKFRGDYR